MRLSNIRTVLVALGLAVSALAAVPAHPGTINYVEGAVSVNGQTITSSSIGSAELQNGAVLRTDSGKAELLLTPGVFLRVGSNSEVRMLSSGLTDTRVAVNHGSAMLEATEIHKENNIQVADGGLNTTIEKKGVYGFDADRSSVDVYDGKAEVHKDDKTIELSKGKETVASETTLKAAKFNRDEAEKTDDLYQWSNLRSKYLSEASAATAQRIIVEPGGWYGSGWYWNPWMRTYSWLPAGDAFFSPFGYGFYAPRFYAPVYVVRGYGGRAYPIAPRGFAGMRGTLGHRR